MEYKVGDVFRSVDYIGRAIQLPNGRFRLYPKWDDSCYPSGWASIGEMITFWVGERYPLQIRKDDKWVKAEKSKDYMRVRR